MRSRRILPRQHRARLLWVGPEHLPGLAQSIAPKHLDAHTKFLELVFHQELVLSVPRRVALDLHIPFAPEPHDPAQAFRIERLKIEEVIGNAVPSGQPPILHGSDYAV